MKTLIWNKDGVFIYVGIAKLAGTEQYMVIYRDELGINLVTPFDTAGFTLKRMPRNRRFDLIGD